MTGHSWLDHLVLENWVRYWLVSLAELLQFVNTAFSNGLCRNAMPIGCFPGHLFCVYLISHAEMISHQLKNRWHANDFISSHD